MPTTERQEKIKRVTQSRQEGVIVLEDIYDPHNAAAVFRSCDAFGFQKVCLIFEQEKEFNPKKVGKVSSASANKWLDFEIYDSTEKCLQDLKKQGYEVCVTVLDDEAQDLFKTKLNKEKVALVFGNEHRGVSEQAIKMADRKIYIPMRGFVQSLNLSVTAAIFMYELTRQRGEK